jgi:hypothetical protein
VPRGEEQRRQGKREMLLPVEEGKRRFDAAAAAGEDRDASGEKK